MSRFLNSVKTPATVIATVAIAAIGTGSMLFYGWAADGPSTNENNAPAAKSSKEPAKPPFETKRGQAGLRAYLESQQWDFTDLSKKDTISISNYPLDLDGFSGRPVLSRPFGFGVHSLPMAKDVKVMIDGKESKLANCNYGMLISLRFAKDNLTITTINITTPPKDERGYVLKSVDVKKRRVSLTIDGKSVLEDLPVMEDAVIGFVGQSNKKAKLSDLKPGMRVSLFLIAHEGRIMLRSIEASE